MILAYLKSNPGSHFMSEIADEVRIDYGLAFKAASELLGSGKIKKSKVQ
ncbi:MAG: DNA-binding MarR family transcriptional regulator [Candidatus Nitrosomirales archaeon]|jgi:DNA-binding MarR family transcriptional regulator